MKIITLFEYQEYNDLRNDVKNKLQSFIEKDERLKDVFVFTSKGIKANQYVGVLKYKNLQFEVLPKLLNKDDIDIAEKEIVLKNLLYMLSLTKKLDIKETDIAKISEHSNPFLEILISIYANSLFEKLKKYVPKNYVIKENNLNFLKGKILFHEHIIKNSTNKTKFYCQYDEFSENNLLNQLFYYVSHLLCLLTSVNDSKKKLKFILNFFHDIHLKTIKYSEIKNLKLTKQQELFAKPFNLAKMFLADASIDMNQNKVDSFALLWDMNKLFEEFIFEFIKKYKHEINQRLSNITAQKHNRLLKHIESQESVGNTYVDIFLEYENVDKAIILDTKYKNHNGSIKHFNNTDIFQVLAYESLHNTNKAILLYITTEESNKKIHFYKFNDIEDKYVITATIYLGSKNFQTDLSKQLNKILTEVLKQENFSE